MNKKVLVAIAGLSALVSACGRDDVPVQEAQQQQQYAPQAQVQPQGQPVIINQQPQSSGVSDMLVGGMVGYMLSGAGSRQSPSPTVVHNHTTVVQQSAPTTTYKPVNTYKAPTQSYTSQSYSNPRNNTYRPVTSQSSSYRSSSIGSSAYRSSSSSFGRRR